MAKMPEPTRNAEPFDVGDEPAPAGTWLATCIDVKDQYGVQRPKFNNPNELETLDVTTFLFGFRDREGNPHKIATRSMRISSDERSALYQTLTTWLGTPPKVGWDYCEMKGKRALITVVHKPSRMNPERVFANIATVTAVPAGVEAFASKAPAAAAPQPPPPPPPAPVEDDPLPF